MPHTIPVVLFDDHGYPTDEALEAIQNWRGTPQSLVDDVLLPMFATGGNGSVEACTGDDGPYEWVTLRTGGWSGCESVIETLQASAFGTLFWSDSHRGGLHHYKVPTHRWASPLPAVNAPVTVVLPDERTTLGALMAAMDCKVHSDTADCPSCGSAPCGPHGPYWYCDEHDWHETDNAEGVCGYALMLARSVLAASSAADEASTTV